LHELTIAAEIVRVVKDSLSSEQLSRVKQINLTLGELTAAHEECLRFSFEAVVRDTPLAKSRLNVELVKARLKCRECKKEYSPEDSFYSPCPNCGAFGGEVISGDELFVTSVDVKREHECHE
jgi:hydrogenase nickel incorporation protein HypA/HybF